VQVAQSETATVQVATPFIDSTKQALTADVTVTNNAGHRFPSGVGFRRAFIEFDVIDNSHIDATTGRGKIIWSSGRANDEGQIIDNDNNPLETEFIGTALDKSKTFQPHFYGPDHPILS